MNSLPQKWADALPTDMKPVYEAHGKNLLGRNLTKEECEIISATRARYYISTPIGEWSLSYSGYEDMRLTLVERFGIEHLLSHPVIAEGLDRWPIKEIHFRYLIWIAGVSVVDTGAYMGPNP